MKRFVIILIIIMVGCKDADVIPFGINAPRIVIEGWLTNRVEQQYIRISRTVPFTSEQRNEVISNATVEIIESNTNTENERFSFTHAEDGYYYSDSLFGGVTGRNYTLIINLPDGRTLRSLPETMREVMPIDTLGYDFFTRESETDPNTELIIYYPVARTSDPPETQDFYRWKLYKNDTLFSAPEEVFLFNDRFLDRDISNYPQQFTNYEYRLNDTIRAERISISREAYEFLDELKAQTTSLGTNTAVSPASVTGNMFFDDSGDASLGFFGTTAITSKEIVITD